MKNQDKTKEQLIEDLALINLLNETANRGGSLKEVIELLAKETRRMFSSFGATIYLLNADGKYLVAQNLNLPPGASEAIKKIIGGKIPAVRIRLEEGSLHSEILKRGKPHITNDPETVNKLAGEFTDDGNFKKLIPVITKALKISSNISIPLVSNSQVIGLIDISNNKPFNEPDLKRLTIIAGQITNIIKNKQAEERIKQAAEEWRMTFDSISDSILIIDRGFNIVRLNKAFANSFGERPQELIGRKCYAVIHNISEPCLNCYFLEIIQTKSSYNKEVFLPSTGIHLGITASPIINGSGEVIGCVRVARDITERRQAEGKIEQAAKEWRMTFDSITDFVSMQDKNYKLTRVNKAFADLFNKKPKELIGKQCYRFFHGTNEPIPDCPLKATIEGKKLAKMELFEPNLGIYLETHTSPVFNDSGEVTGCVHIARDITERKHAEEAIRESEERMRAIGNSIPDIIMILDEDGRYIDILT